MSERPKSAADLGEAVMAKYIKKRASETSREISETIEASTPRTRKLNEAVIDHSQYMNLFYGTIGKAKKP